MGIISNNNRILNRKDLINFTRTLIATTTITKYSKYGSIWNNGKLNPKARCEDLIVIVDDDYDVASLIKISLEKSGFSVSCFTDPLAALEEFRLHSDDYDLVISDLRMPHMNGYEFVQQVKMLRPDIKILIISSFEFDIGFPNNFSRSEVDEFIEKPITLYKLNKIVLTHTINKN